MLVQKVPLMIDTNLRTITVGRGSVRVKGGKDHGKRENKTKRQR